MLQMLQIPSIFQPKPTHIVECSSMPSPRQRQGEVRLHRLQDIVQIGRRGPRSRSLGNARRSIASHPAVSNAVIRQEQVVRGGPASHWFVQAGAATAIATAAGFERIILSLV
uniref:(northern house mosquito) hypothetical protein n=1 Tax=Culex pipiens TaxID=7175 RepID=A0A8D8AFT7_CULPI